MSDTEQSPCLQCQTPTSIADGGKPARSDHALPLLCPACWAAYQKHLSIVRSQRDPRQARPL
jgi:hypothetical protein